MTITKMGNIKEYKKSLDRLFQALYVGELSTYDGQPIKYDEQDEIKDWDNLYKAFAYFEKWEQEYDLEKLFMEYFQFDNAGNNHEYYYELLEHIIVELKILGISGYELALKLAKCTIDTRLLVRDDIYKCINAVLSYKHVFENSNDNTVESDVAIMASRSLNKDKYDRRTN